MDRLTLLFSPHLVPRYPPPILPSDVVFPAPTFSLASSTPQDIWGASTIPHRILPLSALHHPVYHDAHPTSAAAGYLIYRGKTEPSCSEEVLVLGPDSVTSPKHVDLQEFIGADEGGTAS
ncbi:hypothetical protein B0H13DRAFT_2656468 [Mycena leptocephala]|nr:hypothetical protein B0H13DRAFT_2656468 [Mycena leptocephala]